jgi:protein involved in polysaccharide export with SLBB domain
MNRLRKIIASMGRNVWLVLALAVGLLAAAGCAGTGGGAATNRANSLTNLPPSTVIQVDEVLKIEFYDINPTATFEQTVRGDGTITLALGQTFLAAGKNETELRQEIEKRYVPDIYRRLTVNINRLNRYYYVLGEVKNPSQRPYTGELTVLKAIASAGGFTVFADKKKVELTRATGEKLTVNAIDAGKDPNKDVAVYPGDKIDVKLSWK